MSQRKVYVALDLFIEVRAPVGPCGLCFEPVEHAAYVLGCGHKFHQNCDVPLKVWVATCHKNGKTPTCPQCRTLLYGDS